jgi:dTDP-4-dehydrorhamnose reductase
MRNILVTGANGQLGNELRIVTKGCTSGDRYFFTDVTDASPESIEMLRKIGGEDIDISIKKLDITDLEAIRQFVKNNQITITINCAAYTNVDKAETDQELAELLNAKAVENLATAMKEVDGGSLIHVSTDYVFGKEPYNTPCKEEQQGTPTGVYGLTKLYGEQAIQSIGCQHVIIRTAWLYSEFGKNFVKTMLNLTATKQQLKVVFDQVGTPTYARDLAEVIYQIIDSRKAYRHQGVYHYSNEGVCSWYDFAKMIAEYADNTDCIILPCHSDEYPSLVKRPSYSVLDKTKVKETFGIRIPYWSESLKICMNSMKAVSNKNILLI